MRGKEVFYCYFSCFFGITPAYAGKSSTCCRWKSGRRDHPRVCGEKLLFFLLHVVNQGSPPRMRGKVLNHSDPLITRRITPAYAGKRCWRGFSACLGGGITPAYAGKSVKRDEFARVERDHPRVCGEKYSTTFTCKCGLGSPPRMRGKAFTKSFEEHGFGITPAYAGKSSKKEHQRKAVPGSPPRMRGKVFGGCSD